MGAEDKCWIRVGDRPVLERVLVAALAAVGTDGRRVVVVGPRRPTLLRPLWTREDPPGSGPVAGIKAGIAALAGGGLEGHVLVLAGDLPFADRGIADLLARPPIGDADVAIACDSDGRDQYLFALWRLAALVDALEDVDPSAPMRDVYARAIVERTPLPDEALLDCDTSEDVRRARRLAAHECP